MTLRAKVSTLRFHQLSKIKLRLSQAVGMSGGAVAGCWGGVPLLLSPLEEAMGERIRRWKPSALFVIVRTRCVRERGRDADAVGKRATTVWAPLQK